MVSTEMTIRIADMPEILWGIRSEVAKIIEEVAAVESDPRVARRLREIAVDFTAGGRNG